MIEIVQAAVLIRRGYPQEDDETRVDSALLLTFGHCARF